MTNDSSSQNESGGKIHFVELLTVDIDGVPKGMTVPISPISSVTLLEKGSIPSCGLDGSSIKGLTPITDSDLRLIPDISTTREIPGCSPRRAIAFTDVYQRASDGKLQTYPFASRMILRRNYEKLQAKGMVLKVKMEAEYYLLQNKSKPLDKAGYADIFPINRAMDLLLETALDLRSAGIETKWLHSEHGAGQVEIELDFTDLNQAADNFILFKYFVRRRAALQNLEVTFMPKPFPSQAGSGLHCHLQLWQGDKNILGNEDGSLTEKGRHFVGGLITHASAITALANPSINSFKRLVPGFEAPVYICWGYQNRSALLRIPLFTTPENAAVEVRSPDPLANPYLLLTALLNAGLDGIERKIQPPQPVTADVYHLASEKLQELQISQLPDTLNDAMKALLQDEVLSQAFGNAFCQLYTQLRKAEWYEYTHGNVTDCEWEWYLHR